MILSLTSSTAVGSQDRVQKFHYPGILPSRDQSNPPINIRYHKQAVTQISTVV